MEELLTEIGRNWAHEHADDSIVARVALDGYESGWPEQHVALAIRTCNNSADMEVWHGAV